MLSYKECKFPESDEMPENIKAFKRLSIRFVLNFIEKNDFSRHFDDKVLYFLNSIKSLFNNVHLIIGSTKSTENIHILFNHLLPMLNSIRRIKCNYYCLELLEQYFPGTLTLAKELVLSCPEPASIPTCLNWLSAPLDYEQQEPKFLWAYADSQTNFTIVDAVRKAWIFLHFK